MDSQLGSVWPENRDPPHRVPIGLATRTSSAVRITSTERGGLKRYPYPTIVVPVREGGAWQPKAGLAGETRDAVQLLTAVWDRQFDQGLSANTCFFMRAIGVGPKKQDDAWAQIYGRCRRLGLTEQEGILFEVGKAYEGNPRRRAVAEILFPKLRFAKAQPNFEPTFDAAVLLNESEAAIDWGFRHYGRTLEKVLSNQGWSLSNESGWQNPDASTAIRGPRAQATVSIAREAFKPRPRHSFEDLIDWDLSDTGQVVVTEEASASAVLGCLIERHALLASIRDLVLFPAEDGTIWSLFASQMRRFVSSLPSRSRSNYFAALVQAAIQHDTVADHRLTSLCLLFLAV